MHQKAVCCLSHFTSPEKCQLPGLLQGIWLLETLEWPWRRAFSNFKLQIIFQSVHYFLICTVLYTIYIQDWAFSCLLGDCFTHDLHFFIEFTFPFVCSSMISFYKFSNVRESKFYIQMIYLNSLLSELPRVTLLV